VFLFGCGNGNCPWGNAFCVLIDCTNAFFMHSRKCKLASLLLTVPSISGERFLVNYHYQRTGAGLRIFPVGVWPTSLDVRFVMETQPLKQFVSRCVPCRGVSLRPRFCTRRLTISEVTRDWLDKLKAEMMVNNTCLFTQVFKYSA
jgi:hypothetical protein